jgi:hypothetical protein
MSDHVFMCYWYRFCLCLRFCYWILELFWQCDSFFFNLLSFILTVYHGRIGTSWLWIVTACKLSYFHHWKLSCFPRELLTLPEHPSSLPIFSGFHVAQSLVFCVVFSWSLFILLSLFIWSLYCLSCGFWLTLWYFQIFLI